MFVDAGLRVMNVEKVSRHFSQIPARRSCSS
jgi:hypothetical protein